MEKLLHFIWLPSFDKCPSQLWENPAKWQELNPQHRIRLWNGADILNLVHREFPLLTGIFRAIEEFSTDNVSAVKASDLARLLILYRYGGTYADMDTVPLLPISSLFGDPFGTSPEVRHRFTPFTYSRGQTLPSVLSKEDERTELADWNRYDLIFSREHHPNQELGGALVANTVIHARAGSKLLADIIAHLIPNWGDKVLKFAGPFAISKALRNLVKVPAHKGKTYVLPPWYFLWQTWDMGPAWHRTICLHENRMDWTKKSDPVPWNI